MFNKDNVWTLTQLFSIIPFLATLMGLLTNNCYIFMIADVFSAITCLLYFVCFHNFRNEPYKWPVMLLFSFVWMGTTIINAINVGLRL